MTKLSVNVNKVATLRNARGGNVPNLIEVVKKCEQFGADGITVHPRPDQRHITYNDVREISKVVDVEFNVEGYPSDNFIDLVLETKPDQVTLVPDSPDAITSDAGWDTITHSIFLTKVVAHLKSSGIRTSIFVDTDMKNIEGVLTVGADRVELYTENYARLFLEDKKEAVKPFSLASKYANQLGLGVNAGHDLNLQNLSYFAEKVPHLLEVSIGHALVSDSLYYGLENAIQLYKRLLA